MDAGEVQPARGHRLYLPMFRVLLRANAGLEVAGFFVDVPMTAVLSVAWVMLHHTIGTPLAPMQWRAEPPAVMVG